MAGTCHTGYLWLELLDGSFVRKFFTLNPCSSQLLYYADNSLKNFSRATPDGIFDISFLSQAADGSSSRPKVLNCFYIIISGTKYFLKAESEKEKNLWIFKLREASKIQVPKNCLDIEPKFDSGFKVEVVAGVVVKSDADEPSVHCEVKKKRPTQSNESLNSVKSGYCVKQGIIRKNWKTRFFRLTCSSFQYSKSPEDTNPIRTILLKDVVEVRPSIGIHLSRKHVFEVVTKERVFYVQTSTSEEADEWMKAINRCLKDIHGPESLEAGIQTEVCCASFKRDTLKYHSVHSTTFSSSNKFSSV